MLSRPAFAVLLGISLPHVLPAQLGEPTGVEFDARTAINAALGGTWNVHGVVRAGTSYWVSASLIPGGASHRLVEFDEAGTFVGSHVLPAVLAGSTTGLLDLAFDEAAGIVYGSCEHAVAGRQLFAFRTSSRTFDNTANVPLPASAPGTTARGIAFDRFGNGGQGSFFCADGGAAITESSRTGTLLRTLTNPHPNATALAVDDTYRLLWVFGPGGSTRPGQGVVGIAIDLQTGVAAGQMVLGDPAYGSSPVGGTVTGVEFSTYAHDHTVYRFVIATQGTTHTVYELEGRFGYGVRCGGTISFRGDAAYAGNAAWTVTLAGSTAANAFLLLGTRQTVTAPPPLFASGCSLHVALVPAPVIVGGAPVQGGTSQLALPIPPGIQGSVALQWIEAPAGGVPLRSSDGGEVFVRR